MLIEGQTAYSNVHMMTLISSYHVQTNAFWTYILQN